MLAFAVDSLVAILIVFATGIVLLRCLRFPWAWAVMGAPAVSLCVYELLGELFYVMDIPATPFTVCALPLVCLAAFTLLTTRLQPRELDLPQVSWRVLVLYACAGLLFGAFAFVRPLPFPGAVFQAEDIVKHALQIQAFVNSRSFSSLHASVYQDDLAIAPLNDVGFYPCGWHIICALVEQLVGGGVPTAINASNYVLSSLVYPTSALGLLATLLPNRRDVHGAGALACVSVSAFPWALLIFGPLFPNLAALSCLPTVLFLFINATRREGCSMRDRITFCLCFVLASCGMALAHPNAVFSAAVFLIPYCCHIAAQLDVRILGRRTSPRLRACVTALICAAIWAYLRYSSAFRAVAAFNWAAYASVWQALVNIATFSFTYGFGDQGLVAQPIVALAAVLGGRALLKDPKHSWLVASHLFACLICLVCMSTEGELKHLLGGFWYTDPFRLAATAGITALPLVAVGLDTLARVLVQLADRYCLAPQDRTHNMRFLTTRSLIFAALTFLVIIPTTDIPGLGTIETTFTNVRLSVKAKYSMDLPYSPEERTFVERAKQLIEEDAVVINDPLDGSILAYGFDNLHCYYRSRWGYGDEWETPESALIRLRLCDIASAQEVREAVGSIGADYVITLDSSQSDATFLRWYWFPERFEGITSIDETTPGFELVLAEDGMCLYRIAA